MPKYLTIRDVRSMEYLELERWWEVDFDVLVTTVIAEATGDVRPSVREALASDDWIEQWADALYAGIGSLFSDCERMAYTRDPRLPATRERRAQVTARQQHVNSLIRLGVKEEGWKLAPGAQTDGLLAALAILSRHYREEFLELREEACQRRGLPFDSPWRGVDICYADAYDAIEDGVARGLLEVPVTREVAELLAAPSGRVKDEVAEDAKDQTDRCDALRHPLLLRKWSAMLNELSVESCTLNDMKPQFSIMLPRVNMEDLRAMPEEQAGKILNRRRFIRGLAQRYRECEMHKREAVRAVSVRREIQEKPWADASQEARRIVGERHPKERDALFAAFSPYCEPGSTRIRRDALGRKMRGELVHQLKNELANGTLGGGT